MAAAATQWVRKLSSRVKLSLLAGFLAIFFILLITPRSGKLYRPKDHFNPIDKDNQDRDIINSIVVPSYNEGPNMAPL
jgi:cellulose synthase/poly-beta-1,6-N-acetylglucosamine synthase-like glycosyltransferase